MNKKINNEQKSKIRSCIGFIFLKMKDEKSKHSCRKFSEHFLHECFPDKEERKFVSNSILKYIETTNEANALKDKANHIASQAILQLENDLGDLCTENNYCTECNNEIITKNYETICGDCSSRKAKDTIDLLDEPLEELI